MTLNASLEWRCTVCGYVHAGDAPPGACPLCGAPAEAFERVEATPDPPEKAPAPSQWRCTVCGYVHDGPEPPETCPLCGADASLFEVEKAAPEKPSASAGPAQPGRIVVVGGGVAGVGAAESAREEAPEAEIVLLAGEDELPYYRLNLTRFLNDEIGEDALPIHPAAWYEKRAVALRTNCSLSAIDLEGREVVLQDGERLGYDRLVLAAGAHPFVPPLPGMRDDRVVNFRTLADARRILQLADGSQRCAVVGGGILGLETAAALAHRGLEVTVVESHPWLMVRQLNESAGRFLQGLLEARGVRILLEGRTAKISEAEGALQLRMEDGRVVRADFAVTAAGVRPNTYFAREAGMNVGHGIRVDDLLRTSAPDVFAAGDGAEHEGVVYGIWPASHAMGRIAGANAGGAAMRFGGIPRANTLKVVGVDLVSIGRFEVRDGADLVLEREDETAYRRFLLRDNRLVGAVLLGDDSLAPAARKALESGRDFAGALRSRRPFESLEATLSEE